MPFSDGTLSSFTYSNVSCLILTQNVQPQHGYVLSIYILDVIHLLIRIKAISHKVYLFILSDNLAFENKMDCILLYQPKKKEQCIKLDFFISNSQYGVINQILFSWKFILILIAMNRMILPSKQSFTFKQPQKWKNILKDNNRNIFFE